MDIKAFVNLIFRRLWLAILLPLAVGSVSAYVSFYMMTPIYESSTTLYVNNTSSVYDPNMPVDYSALLAGDYLVKDYREIAKSRAVTEAVIQELKLKDITPKDLASTISVDTKNETRIIEISVRNENPKFAMNIANIVSAKFMDKIQELMKVENVNVVDAATLPEAPIEPTPVKNIILAVFLGIAAAIIIILLMDYLDNTIKTPEEIERGLGITVLGSIPVMSLK